MRTLTIAKTSPEELDRAIQLALVDDEGEDVPAPTEIHFSTMLKVAEVRYTSGTRDPAVVLYSVLLVWR